jgi:hypothetical protein
MRNLYDTKLLDATYDAIQAYQKNQYTNEYAVNVADTKREDIEAAVATFITTLSMNFGIGGYNQDAIKQYIPAILFTLYDGYYIYSPTEMPIMHEDKIPGIDPYTGLPNADAGEDDPLAKQRYKHADGQDIYRTEWVLRPYNHYSVRYVTTSPHNVDVTVCYSLDNFIVIYGHIEGEYVTRSGYLISKDRRGSEVNEELDIPKYVPIRKFDEYNSSVNDFPKVQSGTVVEPSGSGVSLQNVTNRRFSPNVVKQWNNNEVKNEWVDTRGTVNSQDDLVLDGTDGNIDLGNEFISIEPSNSNYYIDSNSANKYYEENYGDGVHSNENDTDFSAWVDHYLGEVKPENAFRNGKALKDSNDAFSEVNDMKIFNILDDFGNPIATNNPEIKASDFTEHKREVIKQCLTENLYQAIMQYDRQTDPIYQLGLPEFKANEWEALTDNICIATFMQGVPAGDMYYNNYAIVKSTANLDYVGQDALYFVNYSEPGNDYYHKIDCPLLNADESADHIVGYKNTDFEVKRYNIHDESGNAYPQYYYQHIEGPCYHCMVNGNYNSEAGDGPGNGDPLGIKREDGELDYSKLVGVRAKAYWTALAREKNKLRKAVEFERYRENNIIINPGDTVSGVTDAFPITDNPNMAKYWQIKQ